MAKLHKKIIDRLDRLKSEIDAARPLSADELASLKDYFGIGLAYSSNALEGNTLTISETKVVIEDGITIGGKPMRDHFEALGHAEAFDFVYGLVGSGKIDEADIKELHRLFYYRIEPAEAGVYRTKDVVITGSAHPLPSHKKVPELMQRFIESAGTAAKLHPVEHAAQVHKEF